MSYTIEQLELLKKLYETGLKLQQLYPFFKAMDEREETWNLKFSDLQNPFSHEITTLDNPDELDEFSKKGDAVCIREINVYIREYGLSYPAIAKMAGLPQDEVLFLLQYQADRARAESRPILYSWYLNCRHHPMKLVHFLSHPFVDLKTGINGELVPQRPPFHFQPVHHIVLEKSFSENIYPPFQVYVDLSNTCNELYKAQKGRELFEAEITDPKIIISWFAKRRKEQSKQMERAKKRRAPSMSAEGDSANSTSDTGPTTSKVKPPSDSEEASTSSAPIPATSHLIAPVPFKPVDFLSLARSLGLEDVIPSPKKVVAHLPSNQ